MCEDEIVAGSNKYSKLNLLFLISKSIPAVICRHFNMPTR